MYLLCRYSQHNYVLEEITLIVFHTCMVLLFDNDLNIYLTPVLCYVYKGIISTVSL